MNRFKLSATLILTVFFSCALLSTSAEAQLRKDIERVRGTIVSNDREDRTVVLWVPTQEKRQKYTVKKNWHLVENGKDVILTVKKGTSTALALMYPKK